MNICRSPNSADSTGSAATSSAAGSKGSDCEPKAAGPARKPSPGAMSASVPADSPVPISGSGTPKGRPPSSTGCATHGPFSIRATGNIGQEILDQDGKIIAWTTDEWVAQVICKLLNEHEELLYRSKYKNE